jgi:microcystin-dependent protein
MSEFSSVYYVVHPSKGLIPFYGDFASKQDILDAIGQLGGTFKPLVVSSLPDAGEDGFIYFVPNGVDAGDNQHNEYLYFNGRWELIGSTGIDLTGFATEEALNTHTSNSSIHVTAIDRNRWDSKQDAGDYATNTDLTTGLASKQDAGDYATNTALTTGLAKKQDVGDYATNTALKEGLATKQDVGDYATNSDLTSGLATKVNTAEFSTHTNNGDIHVTLDDKSVWNSAPTNLKLHTGDSDIHVTAKDKAKWNAKQDAGDYATNTALTEGLATKQDVGDYATNTALTEGLATKQAVGDYATNTALTEGLATKQDVGDYATNEALATGLATKQDAGDYATTDELTTHTGNTVIHVTQEDRDRWDAGSNEGVEASIAEVSGNLTTHTGNSDIHVTAEDKEKWNSLPTQLDVTNSVNDAKASLQSDLLTHTGNAAIHVTTEDKANWNAKQDAGDYATNDALTAGLATKQDVGSYATTNELATGLATKQDAGDYATTDELASHTSDTEIHVTAEDKARWDAGSNEGVEASISEVKDSLGTHVGDTSIHVTTDEKDAWNAKQGAISTVNVSKSDDASSIADGALNVNLPTDWFTQADIDLSDYAKTAEVVTLAGTQTISGVKTFSSAPKYASVLTSSSTDSYLVNKATLYRSVPVGAFMWFCGTEVPTGWLECDGSSLSRTSYAKLYAVIGTTYGEGDGDGKTFSLPDLTTVGRFIRSRTASNTVGTCQHDMFITLSGSVGAICSASTVNSHTGVLSWGGVASSGLSLTSAQNWSNIVLNTSSISKSGSEVRPYNLALIACIKY